MSLWASTTHFLKRFEYASTNQYGARYKRVGSVPVHVCRISVELTDASGLADLIRLSDRLQIPIHWDWETPQKGYIDLVAFDKVKEVMK